MSNEEDLEMGIRQSPTDDENGGTNHASGATNGPNSYAQDIAGVIDADADTQPSSTTTLLDSLDSQRIHDVVDSTDSTPPSTASAAANTAVRAAASSTSANSTVRSNGEKGEDTARGTRGAPTSVVSTNRDDLEPVSAESSPLFADEPDEPPPMPPPVSNRLTGLDGSSCENVRSPMTDEEDATSPRSLDDGGMKPQIQEEYYDVESPSSYLYTFTGPEEAVLDDVAPLPPGAMIQSNIESQIKDHKMRGGLIKGDDHNDGPPAAPADSENEYGVSGVTSELRGEVPEEARDEGDGPNPFGTAAAFEDANITEKVRGRAASDEHGLDDGTGSQLHSDSDTRANSRNENEAPPQTNTADLDVCPVDAGLSSNEDLDTEDVRVTSSDADIPLGDGDGVSNMAPAPDVDQDGSVIRIPEAYLVEPPAGEDGDNGEIVMATHLDPPVPLWKQKRVVCFLSSLMVCVIIISVQATSSFLGRQETIPEVIAPPITLLLSDQSDSPSSSTAPTTVRSSSPSHSPSNIPSNSPSVTPTTVRSSLPSYRSFAPSLSPSSCSDIVSMKKQTLNMPLESLVNPQVAVDGRNMVEVAKDPNFNFLYVVFYSLGESGWVRKGQNYIDDYEYAHGYSVALSGTTALVGLRYANTDAGEVAGLVYIYEQDSRGVWIKARDPIIPDGGSESEYLGNGVDIDADLACVAYNDVYIFRRDGGQQWEQIQRLSVNLWYHGCSIVDNTIALQSYTEIHTYQLDEELGEYVPRQNTVSANADIFAMSLSKKHLVYSTGQYGHQGGNHVGKEVFIYHRQDTYQPFSLLQHFNTSDFDDDIVHTLALDYNILVIGTRNKTYVFSKQNDVFEKSLSLNQRYESVEISFRSLIATTNEEVHAFAIDDCVQAVPTQTPSSSFSPTESPSSLPSISPSTSPSQLPSMTPTSLPSAHPTASFSPTETCYWMDVSVAFDEYSEETSWDFRRINDVGDKIVVKTYQGTNNDELMLQKISMCLEEGQYEFTIYDSCGDGLSGDAYYNVTSYGALIVEGRRFRRKETTTFTLPLPLAPSAMPSISYKPSSSANPSVRPSSSSTPTITPAPTLNGTLEPTYSPTETCYWMDVSVAFDRCPDETSWDVERIDDVGDKTVVKTYQGTNNDELTLRKESMCLEEGQYEFTIYDSYNDGLDVVGYYNVTSYGALIVEGRRFRREETTAFTLPLHLAPSARPSISYKPSSSANPSARPSSSSTPTRTPAPTLDETLEPTYSPTEVLPTYSPTE